MVAEATEEIAQTLAPEDKPVVEEAVEVKMP